MRNTSDTIVVKFIDGISNTAFNVKIQ